MEVREIIRTGPRRRVFDVIVAGHVLRSDGDAVLGRLGQQQGSGEPADAGSCSMTPVSEVFGLFLGRIQ